MPLPVLSDKRLQKILCPAVNTAEHIILISCSYPNVQIFMRAFREMESVVGQYNRNRAEQELQTSRKPTAALKDSADNLKSSAC